MSVIHGHNVQIYGSSGVLIAAAKSCVVSKRAEVIEKASSSNQTSREYISGRVSWTVELSHLIVSTATSGGIPMVGSSYTVRMMVNGSQVLSGTAICQEASIQATNENLAVGNIKLQGTGNLS